MELKLVAAQSLLFLLALKLWLNEAVVFKLTNSVCINHNETLVTMHECRLRAISRNKTILNVNATLHHRVYSADVRGQLFKKANGYKPWLLAGTIDACRFLKKAYNPFAIIIYKFIKEQSNFNHTCPYIGPILIKDVYLSLDKLPHLIPTGDYRLTLDFIVYNISQVTANIYFEFVENLL